MLLDSLEMVGLQHSMRMDMRALPLLAFTAELLALDAAELDARMEHEVATNPAIQLNRRCCRCGALTVAAVCPRCRFSHPVETDRVAAAASARAELLADARALAPHAVALVVEAVVASLNPRGLLTETTPEAIQALVGCSSAELERALQAVRRAGPAGVACFDARTCLLAKIDEASGQDNDLEHDWDLPRRIVASHLAALASGDLDAIAARLGVSVEEVAAAAIKIRNQLTPYPDIDLHDDGALPPPPPDIVFTARQARVEVEVNDPWRGAVKISEDFAQPCALVPDQAARAFMRDQTGRARLLVAALDRRRKTIEAVASAVAFHHQETLLAGSSSYSPLHRRDVAAKLGVHESTVSRAARHRTVRLPDGKVVPLAALFGSGHDVRTCLAGLMASGERRSDQQFADLLRSRGIVVARRTVAKYRHQIVAFASSSRQRSVPELV
jgi:RNA polymerase sigma-54 factor